MELVCHRARWMQQCAEESRAGMLAVLKLSQEQVEQLCGQFSQVYPVNYNCPGQLVVSCSEQEKQALCEQVKALGGKAVELAVSGGFHSPFMSRAAEQMAGASLIGFDARSCDAGLCKQYSPSLP